MFAMTHAVSEYGWPQMSCKKSSAYGMDLFFRSPTDAVTYTLWYVVLQAILDKTGVLKKAKANQWKKSQSVKNNAFITLIRCVEQQKLDFTQHSSFHSFCLLNLHSIRTRWCLLGLTQNGNSRLRVQFASWAAPEPNTELNPPKRSVPKGASLSNSPGSGIIPQNWCMCITSGKCPALPTTCPCYQEMTKDHWGCTHVTSRRHQACREWHWVALMLPRRPETETLAGQAQGLWKGTKGGKVCKARLMS